MVPGERRHSMSTKVLSFVRWCNGGDKEGHGNTMHIFTHSDLGPPSYKTSPNMPSEETTVLIVLNDGEQQP